MKVLYDGQANVLRLYTGEMGLKPSPAKLLMVRLYPGVVRGIPGPEARLSRSEPES